MSKTLRGGAFTGGDEISRYLIDLAAGRPAPIGGPVPAGLVELAQRHGLIPLLSKVTDDFLVRAINARETSRRRVLERHLQRILTAFHDRGIRVSVQKGPAIAMRYRDPMVRTFTDVDLLVPESEVEGALELLAADPAAISIPAKRPKADKRDVLFGDESGIRFNVDLHWDLYSYSQLRGSADGATEAAWAEARLDESTELGPMWDIPEGYRLAFLAAHAMLDHRFRLILFRDFLELARAGVDWDSVRRVTDSWGLRSTTYSALWIGKEVLDVDVPDVFLASVRPDSFPLRFLQWSLPKVDLIRFDGHRPHPVNLGAVLLNDSFRQRVSLVLRAPAAFPRWRQRVAEGEIRHDNPRTLILASTDRRRGAEVFSERLREGLTARGWVAEAVSLKSYGEQPVAELQRIIPPGSVTESRFDLRLASALLAKIRSFRPDVVLANGGVTLRYAVALRPFGRFKLAYIGIGEPDFWIRSRLSRLINRWMLRRVDLILTVSEATRKQTERLEPRLAGQVRTMYPGVPEELFRVPPLDPSGPLRVLMVGSLSDEKDPELALEATAAIPSAHLRFVGEGPLRGRLMARAAPLNMDGRIEFTGSVDDVTPHLEWAHVLVLTSKSEGLPGAILEASAAGVPTVGVDVGGVREAVADGVSGYITSRSSGEITEALHRLDQDRRLLVEMGEAARDHAERNFMLDQVVETYARTMRQLAK